MSFFTPQAIFRILLFIRASVTIVASFGIVWRVQGLLKRSWIFILIAYVFFWVIIVIELVTRLSAPLILALDIPRFIGAVFFVLGVFEMESVLRAYERKMHGRRKKLF